MTNKNISIRLAVVDGDKVRKDLSQTGQVGEKALLKIKEAASPATKSLLAINVAAEQVQHCMSSLSGNAGQLGVSLSRLGVVGAVSAAALGGLVFTVTHALREFKSAEKALNQLAYALSSTDFAAGVTFREMAVLAEKLASTSLFKKEAFEQAAAHLTTFGNIQGQVFKRALTLSRDLAVRLGVDIPAAADLLAGSLEHPEQGLGRLKKKFTDLSAAQKETIENFVHQGDVATAQGIILSHLEQRIKGLAEAQSQGLAGSTKFLNDAWGDLLVSFGNIIQRTGLVEQGIRSLTSALKGLKELIDPRLSAQKSHLEREIEMIEKSVWGKQINGSSLEAKQKALAEINRQLLAEQQKIMVEENQAHDKSQEAATKRRHAKLLELEKQYLREYKNLTLSSQQKIFKEYEERYKQINFLNKDGADSSGAKSAAKALDDLTKAKINESASATDSKDYETAKAALDSWKKNLVQNLDEASPKHQKYLRLVEDVYGNKLQEIYKRSTINHYSWVDGATAALNRYFLAAKDSASNAEKVFGKAASKIEDLFVDLAASGEFSFRKIGDAILAIEKDFLRSFMRKNVTGPLFGNLSGMMQSASTNIFGSIFAKLFHSGGKVSDIHRSERLVPAAMFISAPRLHSGLMADEFPAILQRGETVLPKNAKVAGGINITFNIQTPNAQSFVGSQGQIMSTLASQLQKHHYRNS